VTTAPSGRSAGTDDRVLRQRQSHVAPPRSRHIAVGCAVATGQSVDGNGASDRRARW